LYFQFLVRPDYRGDMVPYLMVITAESFIIFHALMAMWTILAGTLSPRNFGFHDAQSHLYSSNPERKRYADIVNRSPMAANGHYMYLHHRPITVDVFITVYGEPLEDIYSTVIAARDMV